MIDILTIIFRRVVMGCRFLLYFISQYSCMKKYLIILCSLILSGGLIYGQNSVLSNNRTGLKWQQINTDDFKILYPIGFGGEAQRMANTLQFLHDPIDKTLQTSTRKATIILQNQNSIANGFVTLGPRRSEFFTSAPQDYNFLGTNDWLNTLAIHEYRHLTQFNKSRTGFNKFFYYLFGENTQAVMATIAAPAWFWEGDATATETAFSQSGRGRIPAFDRIYRANLLEGKRYNYNKQSLRSYKDFVPDHYVIGYHMITHLRKKTGDANVFSKVTERAFGTPFIPFTFSNALKNKTGKYVVQHYEEMMDELDREWRNQLSNTELSSFEKITKRANQTFTDYACPAHMANGKLFAIKSGIGDIDQFVMIGADGSEEKLFVPGILNNSGMFSVAGNTAAWNEFTFDSRWRKQSYSVIKLYNQDTETLKVLTKKTRYHGVSLSPDTKQVATVESLENGIYRLVILDASTGSVIKQFNNKTQGILTLPAWSSDGQKITFLSNASEKKSVQMIDVQSEEETTLISASTENIGNPSLIDNHLFYQSDYSGVDNIYALDTDTGKRYQVTSSKYGAYNVGLSNDKKTIFYNDHSIDGLDIVRTAFDAKKWIPLNQTEQNGISYYKVLVEQENHAHILDSIPNTTYETKNYSRLKGLINPHSWGPFVNTDDLNELQAGVFSQDKLSTTSIYAGYNYNRDTKDGAFVGRVSYQGFYPILDFEFSKGNRTSGNSSWNEQTIEYGVRLPLLLTKSKYLSQLSIGNSIGITKVTKYKNGINNLGRFVDSGIGRQLVRNSQGDVDTVDVPTVRLARLTELSDGELTFNHFEFSYSRLLKQSTRDINSKLGLSLVIERFDRLSGDFNGGLSALRYSFYLPGFAKHHSINVRGGFQSRELSSAVSLYAFPNRIFKPRGRGYFTEKKFTSILFNYALPIWYPDFAIGPVLNIKRMKLNLFSDFGQDEIEFFFLRESDFTVFDQRSISSSYSSFGAELTFDINVMRALPELEIGARFVYASAVPSLGFPSESKIEFIIGNISF